MGKLVNNLNNSYNSGIKCVPNEVNSMQIEQIMTEKLSNAITHQGKQFSTGDTVRCIVNKKVFEKGAVPKWSKKIHQIKGAGGHSYLLDNNKWYKYYQLQKVELAEEDKSDRLQEMEKLKKERTIKRRLNKEGIELSRITRNQEIVNQLTDCIIDCTNIVLSFYLL